MRVKALALAMILTASPVLAAAPQPSLPLSTYILNPYALAPGDVPFMFSADVKDGAFVDAFRGRGGFRGGGFRGGGFRGGGFRGGGFRGGGFRGGGFRRGGVAYRGGVGRRGGVAYRGRVVAGRGGYAYRGGVVAGRGRGFVVRRSVVVGGIYRPYGAWWRPGAAIAAGAAIGFVGAATAAAWAGAPPAAGYCWYYTDASRTRGFWDRCPA
jgi:hypothetical protein